MTLKSHAKIEKKTDLWFGKMTWGIWQIFIRTLESVKIGIYFHGTFLSNVENARAKLKIYRGVICNDTEKWLRIWRGIDLSLQCWHKRYDKFWHENSKVSKMYTLMTWIWPKYITFELKKVQRSYISWHWEWCEIWPEHSKISKTCTLMGSFCI